MVKGIDQVLTAAQMPVELENRIKAYAIKHYEGNFSMAVRALILKGLKGEK